MGAKLWIEVKRHLIASVLGNEIPVRACCTVLTPCPCVVCACVLVFNLCLVREREREGERVELGATLPLLRLGHCADTLHRIVSLLLPILTPATLLPLLLFSLLSFAPLLLSFPRFPMKLHAYVFLCLLRMMQVYIIECTVVAGARFGSVEHSWSIQARFSKIADAHTYVKELVKRCLPKTAYRQLPQFPKKKLVGSRKVEVIEERRVMIDAYFRALCAQGDFATLITIDQSDDAPVRTHYTTFCVSFWYSFCFYSDVNFLSHHFHFSFFIVAAD